MKIDDDVLLDLPSLRDTLTHKHPGPTVPDTIQVIIQQRFYIIDSAAAVPECDAAGATVPAQQLPAEERHHHDQVVRQPRQGGHGNMGQHHTTCLKLPYFLIIMASFCANSMPMMPGSSGECTQTTASAGCMSPPPGQPDNFYLSRKRNLLAWTCSKHYFPLIHSMLCCCRVGLALVQVSVLLHSQLVVTNDDNFVTGILRERLQPEVGGQAVENAPTSALTFKTLLRHYAKQALNPW